MSLVDVWISPSKALVAVDTESIHEGKWFEMSKMLVLPHANVVIAGRGLNLFLSALHAQMHQTMHQSFDDYAEAMPDALDLVMGHLTGVAHTFPLTMSIHKQEVVLVGYSRARGEMWCVAYESEDESGFSEQEVDQAFVSPWAAEWGAPFNATTPAHVRSFAAEQVGKANALHPDQPCGGRLLLAELTRDDVRMSSLGILTARALSP